MREKAPIVGKDADSAEALLKKHEALMSDINSYRNVIDGLHDEAQKCKVRRLYFELTFCLHKIS